MPTAVLLDSGRLTEGALFASIVLHEPAKDVLARWKPGDPVERRVRAVLVPGSGVRRRRGGRRRGRGRDRGVGRGRRDAAHAPHARSRAGDRHDHRRIPEYQAALARRGITGDMLEPHPDRPVAGGCVRVRVRGGTPHLALHLVPARRPDRQRVRAPDRGPHRALRQRAQRGARGQRPRRHAAAAEPCELSRRRPAADAHRPEADRDHPARRSELHGRGQPRPAGRSGSSASRSIRSRASCCIRSATTTTTAGCVRSCTARRSARWSFRTATPTPCTAGRTRSTRASGASAA